MHPLHPLLDPAEGRVCSKVDWSNNHAVNALSMVSKITSKINSNYRQRTPTIFKCHYATDATECRLTARLPEADISG